MAKILRVVERNRAEKLFRFLNYVIDFIFAIFIVIIVLNIYNILKYFLPSSGLEGSTADVDQKITLGERVLIVLMYSFILFLTELVTKGRSLGKLITGTKVVKIDGSNLTVTDLLKRNFLRAVPFDFLSFIGNNGWHDNFSDTAVVKKKRYDRDQNIESDLIKLGNKENL